MKFWLKVNFLQTWTNYILGRRVPRWLKRTFLIKQVKTLKEEKIKKQKEAQVLVKANERNLTNAHSSRTIDDIYKLVEHTCNLFEKRQKEKKFNQIIINEWQEMAKRLDFLLLIIFTTIGLLIASMLFRKMYFNPVKINQENCECSFKNWLFILLYRNSSGFLLGPRRYRN